MLFAISIYKFGKVIDPPPAGINLHDIGAVERFYTEHPIFLEFVLAGHVIGTFVGAYVTALIAKNHNQLYAIIIGILCLGLGILDIVHFQHPLWFDITNTIAYLPAALIGGYLGAKLCVKKQMPQLN